MNHIPGEAHLACPLLQPPPQIPHSKTMIFKKLHKYICIYLYTLRPQFTSSATPLSNGPSICVSKIGLCILHKYICIYLYTLRPLYSLRKTFFEYPASSIEHSPLGVLRNESQGLWRESSISIKNTGGSGGGPEQNKACPERSLRVEGFIKINQKRRYSQTKIE